MQLARPEKKVARYHHGDLRAALLTAVGQIIAERGLEGLTLRECARRAGVSHNAPAHHFGTLAGLLTEFAADGFEKLAVAMASATVRNPDDALKATGIEYVHFALTEPGLFQIMWRSELLDQSSPRLQDAMNASTKLFTESLKSAYVAQYGRTPSKAWIDARFELAWCCVHGYAALSVERNEKARKFAAIGKMLDLLRPALFAPEA